MQQRIFMTVGDISVIHFHLCYFTYHTNMMSPV